MGLLTNNVKRETQRGQSVMVCPIENSLNYLERAFNCIIVSKSPKSRGGIEKTNTVGCAFCKFKAS